MSLRIKSTISAGTLGWPIGLTLACACLLMLASSASAASLTWTPPRLVDHQEPYGAPNGMNSVSCASASFCVAVDAEGRAVSSTHPAAGAEAWTSQVIGTLNDALDDVSCPEASLCVAVRTDGAILTSTEPTGGVDVWNTATVESTALDGVSCPSTELCVAVGYSGEVFTATRPSAGASAWTRADIDANRLERVSCASPTLCVAVDNAGDVLTSTEPTGGASAWHAANIDGINHIDSVSCPSAALCVAVDSAGNALTSTNPAGGGNQWKSVKIDTTETRRGTQSELRGISCSSAASCVAVDSSGNIASSNDPTGTAGAWTLVNVDGAYEFSQVSCTNGQCVATDRQGNIVTSTNPLGGAADWQVAHVNPGTNGPTAVACPSTALCVATDASGNVLAGVPTAEADSWSVANIDPPPFEFPMGLTGVSCASQSFCAAVGTGEIDGYGAGNLAISDEPGGGASAWHLTSIDVDDPLTAVACPSESLCVALSENDLETSTEPAAGASTWHLTSIAGNPSVLSGISCPSAHLCVAVASSGEVLTSTDPQGGEAAWNQTSLSEVLGPSAIACPSEELCVVVGSAGQIVTSKDPTGGAAAWTTTRIDGTNRLEAVACGSSTSCVAVDEAGNALTSSDPAGGEAAWTAAHVDAAALTGVSCVEASLCVAVDAAGNVVVGTTPSAGGESEPNSGSSPVSRSSPSSSSGSESGTSASAATAATTPSGPGSTPIAGKSQTVNVLSGTVMVRLQGTTKFVPLAGASTIPDGSEVEATNGHVLVTVATLTPGKTQSAEVWGGRFLIHQEHTGLRETRFVLSLPLTGCPRVVLPHGAAAVLAASAKHSSGPKSRHLWVSEGGGSWGTTGRYVSTSVEGTHWLTLDECDRSRVTVAAGNVKVRDLIHRRTKILTAGGSYVAAH